MASTEASSAGSGRVPREVPNKVFPIDGSLQPHFHHGRRTVSANDQAHPLWHSQHQLGLDSRLLEVPGRKRLDIDHGKPILEILA